MQRNPLARFKRNSAGLLDRVRGWRAALGLLLLAVVPIGSPAQTFSTLVSFDGTNGEFPEGPLTQGLDGNLYGLAIFGGANSGGTAFQLTTTGTLVTLYSFCAQANCTDGQHPTSGLILASDGNFYGTTGSGGAFARGTVFRITPAGSLTILYSFCAQANCTDGAGPGWLVLASDGNLYGTTAVGGLFKGPNGNGGGTFFQMSLAGALTTLYSFCAQTNCADGEVPGGLIQATDGNFYGITVEGGIEVSGTSFGTVFRVTSTGVLTTLHAFCAQANCPDGALPGGRLLQATDGNFYGTTAEGGLGGSGSVYKITSAGALTTLYSFSACPASNCTNGYGPRAGVIEGTDRNLYGTTNFGGFAKNHGVGTVFQVSTSGLLKKLHSFCPQPQQGCPDGAGPMTELSQATDGNFYGTTPVGGAFSNNGTIFKVNLKLPPFVETKPTSGKVGASIIILGTNLTAATHVTFNGRPAAFTVVSSSEITTTVPAGATTGKVRVVTPQRTLLSNVPFRVTP